MSGVDRSLNALALKDALEDNVEKERIYVYLLLLSGIAVGVCEASVAMGNAFV